MCLEVWQLLYVPVSSARLWQLGLSYSLTRSSVVGVWRYSTCYMYLLLPNFDRALADFLLGVWRHATCCRNTLFDRISSPQINMSVSVWGCVWLSEFDWNWNFLQSCFYWRDGTHLYVVQNCNSESNDFWGLLKFWKFNQACPSETPFQMLILEKESITSYQDKYCDFQNYLGSVFVLFNSLIWFLFIKAMMMGINLVWLKFVL